MFAFLRQPILSAPRFRPLCELLEGRELPALSAGAPSLVSTLNFNGDPTVASSRNGMTLVAWSESTTLNGTNGLQGQLLDAQGNQVSGPLAISPNAQPGSVRAALDGQGNSVVVWNTNRHIIGERFSASGQQLGANFTVATRADTPDVAMDSKGNFVVTYDDARGDVVATLYRPNAQPRQTILVAHSKGTHDQWSGSVAASPDGHFDIGAVEAVLSTEPQLTAGDSAWAYRYTANGTRLSATRIGGLGPDVMAGGADVIQTDMDDAGNAEFAFQLESGAIEAVGLSATGKRLGHSNIPVPSNSEVNLDGLALARRGGQFVIASDNSSSGQLLEFSARGQSTGSLPIAGRSLALASVGTAALDTFFAAFAGPEPAVASIPHSQQILGQLGMY
jgi:hypothetical protein